MDVNEFANPLIFSWITAFIRSVGGELMHDVHKRGGTVVSVTTDGFITDLSSIEPTVSDFSLYNQYCKIRKELSGNPEGLELKTSVTKIVS